MEKSIYYVIDGARTSDEKADARRSLKQRLSVVKVVRIEYQTGPTKVVTATTTIITETKDI